MLFCAIVTKDYSSLTWNIYKNKVKICLQGSIRVGWYIMQIQPILQGPETSCWQNIFWGIYFLSRNNYPRWLVTFCNAHQRTGRLHIPIIFFLFITEDDWHVQIQSEYKNATMEGHRQFLEAGCIAIYCSDRFVTTERLPSQLLNYLTCEASSKLAVTCSVHSAKNMAWLIWTNW